MSKNKIFFFILYLIFSNLLVFSQELEVLSKDNVRFIEEKRIKIGDIEIKAGIKGVPSAYETYDIHATFDGRVDEIITELFDKVDKKTLLAKMVSKDMGAILDTANKADPESKKEILKRWKGTFDYFNIFPTEAGIVTEIHVKPGDEVNKGDRLFTIAKKMQIIATNTEPIYSELSSGMKANMFYIKNNDIKVDLTLKHFIPLKNKKNYYRMWLDIEELKDKVIVGELFQGTLYIGQSKATKLIPKNDVIFYNDKRYVIMEIKTGLISEDEVEILSPTLTYIKPEKSEEVKNGNTKTTK